MLPHHFLVMGNYQVALPKISAAEAELSLSFSAALLSSKDRKRNHFYPVLCITLELWYTLTYLINEQDIINEQALNSKKTEQGSPIYCYVVPNKRDQVEKI